MKRDKFKKMDNNFFQSKSIKTNNPKIGVILASHLREPSNFSLKLLKKGLILLKEKKLEVHFNDKPLTSDSEIRSEINKLKKIDVDVFLIVPGNWIEPPVLSHPLEEIRDENIILLGFPESLKLIKEGHFLGSNSAFTVLRNSLSQMGFKFKSIQKFPYDTEAVNEIADFSRASLVSNKMRRIKIGLIGYCSMGIYTTCFDQQKIRKVFGTEIDCSADTYILYEKMKMHKKDKIITIKNNLKERCKISDSIIKNGSLEKSLRMYIALKEMISKSNWEGVTVKCQHELSTYLKCTACLPLSMLTDEGIMCTDEGDVHALLTMIIMKYLAEDSSPLYFGDMYKLDEGGFLLSHCGLSPHSCAEEGSTISLLAQDPRISKDRKNTGGVISSYKFKEGPVTIGRIENDRKGTYYFHFSKGYIRPEISAYNNFSTAFFTTKSDDQMFASNQLANHYVFIYEDIKNRILEFCKINNLRAITNNN